MIEKLKERYDKRYTLCLTTTFIGGVLAMGMKMFNQYSFHDDLFCTFYLGSTVSWGRWMLRIIWDVLKFILGGSTYNVPLLNGALSLFLFVISECIIVNLFDIRKKSAIILVTLFPTVFPATASLFAYMHTAPAYAFSILLSIVSAYIICRDSNRIRAVLLGSLMLCLSLGIYQAYLSVGVGIVFLFLLMTLITEGFPSWKAFFNKGFDHLFILMLGVVEYYVVTVASSKILNEPLVGVSGISSFGTDTGLSGYGERIIEAYSQFVFPSYDRIDSMYPGRTRYFYLLALALIFVYLLINFMRWKKDNCLSATRFAQLVIMLIAFPIASNLIYIMSGDLDRALAMYGQLLPYLFLILLYEKVKTEDFKLGSWIRYGSEGLLFFISFVYCEYDNALWLKESYYIAQADRIYTSLITRIQSVEGYDHVMPVLVVGENQLFDATYKDREEFEIVRTDPINFPIINDYAWKEYMTLKLGFSPRYILETDEFARREEIKDMPTYPADGSIKVIDDCVVVKFAEAE